MKLPHEKPIRFVKSIIKKHQDEILLSCLFPYPPSLAMICESAAQSSAAFANEEDSPKLGFLVSLKNIELIDTLLEQEAQVRIKKVLEFGQMSEFYFQLEENEKIYAVGNITIAMKEE